jgi:hypothetical protein
MASFALTSTQGFSPPACATARLAASKLNVADRSVRLLETHDEGSARQIRKHRFGVSAFSAQIGDV